VRDEQVIAPALGGKPGGTVARDPVAERGLGADEVALLIDLTSVFIDPLAFEEHAHRLIPNYRQIWGIYKGAPPPCSFLSSI